jgi:anti-sigma factor RsiW
MDTCERFELAIEMNLHGALPPGEREALDAHLRTCASCREFARKAEHTQQALQASSAVAPPDVKRVLSHVDAELRTQRLRLLRVCLVLAVLFPVLGLAVGRFWVSGLSVGLVAAVVLPTLTLRQSRLAREASRVGESPEELVALYRRTLEANLRRARRQRRFFPVLGVVELFLTTNRTVPWPASLNREPMMWVGIVVALVCFARAVYVARWVLPRLRRELEALG